MNNTFKHTLVAVIALQSFFSCQSVGEEVDISMANTDEVESRGIYYWKTVFDMDDHDYAFLEAHKIDKMYIRFFDVSLEKNWERDATEIVPIGTIKFRNSITRIKTIIPTVYITIDALREAKGHEDELAEKIVRRVFAIASYNNLPPVKEVQFDCDWTEATRWSYRCLCESAKKYLMPKGAVLSGTIRLHQIAEAEYPFDKGVVMIYNTGNFKSENTRNSIIDYEDVRAYIKPGYAAKQFIEARKRNCKTIDFAYPTYSWGVMFENGEFKRLLHRADFSDTTFFKMVDARKYQVVKGCVIEGDSLEVGNIIRLEKSEFTDIAEVQAVVSKVFGSMPSKNIIYHYDSDNMANYSSDEIEKIYSRY